MNKLAWQGIKSDSLRNTLIISSTALLTTFASVIFAVTAGMAQETPRQDYMVHTLREMAMPFHLMGRNAQGPWLNPVLLLTPVLLCSFLLIYQCFYLSMLRDIRTHALLSVSGLTKRQKRAVMMRQGLLLWGFGILAAIPLSLGASLCVSLLLGFGGSEAPGDTLSELLRHDDRLAFFGLWIESALSWRPEVFFLACLPALPIMLLGCTLATDRMRRVSLAAALTSDIPPHISLRETTAAAMDDRWQSLKASIKSWYIWNTLKKTKNFYLTEEGRQRAVSGARRRRKQLEQTRWRDCRAGSRYMAFHNALRSVQMNGAVIVFLCMAVLIFALSSALFSDGKTQRYTGAEKQKYDFILTNATCRVDYYDPKPPLLGPPEPKHVFGISFLDELKAREGLTVSVVEVAPGAHEHMPLLKEIKDNMIYQINIQTDAAHFTETEAYLNQRFQDSYQVWIDNGARIAFQEKAQRKASYVFGLLLAVTVAVTGVLGFVNTSAIGLDGRRGEFATLRSLGMTKRQLRRMLALEGLFLCAPIPALTAPVLIATCPPGLWLSIYLVMGCIMTAIPYIIYVSEQSKPVAGMLR